MIAVLRQLIPGMLVLAALSAATVALITAPGRANLADLHVEAVRLAERERELVNRLAAIQAEEAGRLQLPDGLVWDTEGLKPVDIAMQEALVAAAGAAGLQLVSFGQSAVPEKSDLATLGFEVELTGTHEGLARFLSNIEAMSPALAVSYLWLRQLPPDPTKAGAPISIRMTVWGFRTQADAP
ncbi:MAG: GspMb/PilO family protein [Tabrizicola sp.]|jgi:hypothetical protein|nr:GspMb/PilO family protein [Tabrizicola sp.]